jgi:hypothetical protein
MAEGDLINLDRAIEELGAGGTPSPEDFIPRYSPLATLWFTRQTALQTAMKWTEDLQVPGMEDVDGTDILSQVTLGIAKAAALLTECCVVMEMISPAEGEAPPDDLFNEYGEEAATT